MAQCIECNVNIPDGTQLCENCSSQEKIKADESYLDSLLSSITPFEDTKDIYWKDKQQRNKQHENEIREKHTRDEKTEDSLVKPIPKDYSIFSTSDNDSEMEFLNSLFGNMEESDSDELIGFDTQEGIDELKDKTEEIFEYDKWNESGTITPKVLVTAEEEQDKTLDDLLADTLSMTDQVEYDVEVLPEQDIEKALTNYKEEEPVYMKDAFDFSDNDQDILDLINEINNTGEFIPEEELESQQVASEEMKQPEDSLSIELSDIYADALSAVTQLDDMQFDQDLMNMIPTKVEPVNQGKETLIKNSKKGSNHKKNQSKPETKVSLWKRVFGNVKEEISEEKLEARKQKAIEEGEKKEQSKLKQAEELKAKKERSKAEKAENARKAKEEVARKKAEAAVKAKAKKEEKERHSKEIQELIDEIDENEGKINKVGASIIFVFFAAAAIVIVIGTNLYSYAININTARESFSRQLYDDAYQNVYGIDVKEEDLEIYDKIMTVMYVNKQLNSYTNFLNMKKYPEALDSLLKGLERYEQYYMLASLHGIESDLNYVKDHIIEELNETFLLSEDEARVLLAYDDQTKYSEAVYELANEHVEEVPEEEVKAGEQSEADSKAEQDSSIDTEGTKGN